MVHALGVDQRVGGDREGDREAEKQVAGRGLDEFLAA